MKRDVMWHGTIGSALIGTCFLTIGYIAYLLYGDAFFSREEAARSAPDAMVRGTPYVCEGGRMIGVSLSETAARLSLSDGREVILPGSGQKYANADESFVLVFRGAGAFVFEAGIATYSGCAEQ